MEFGDALRLVAALGFEELRVTGSHHIYGRPGLAEQLNLQDRRSKAKPYQLRQLASLVRRYNLSLEANE
ncbi:MAG TPA: type II toxin-antitoxin system HicA family toxin [Acidimicrobiales bacterium]|nr:type II toxin-antitoxin system HicA family toxin [Acidimicrobiales bacterium]